LKSKKNILICPLDWGLGHATRCVPIIKECIHQGANVILAASNRPLAFLKKEFPNLTFIDFPGYNIKYPENGKMVFSMLKSAPGILKAIKNEKKILEKIIHDYNIDIVISDNRFGLQSKDAYCIYITHQVMIKCPPSLSFLEKYLYKIHRSYIKKYDECWIPDFANGINLSGDLSHKYPAHKNTFFIQPLSRFNLLKPEEKKSDKKYDVIVVLSGPEPQRSIFEEIVLEQAKTMNHIKFLFVRGITEEVQDIKQKENISMVSHLETEALRKAMIESGLIICRPGYSSIMDIVKLNKNAVFVPTPGQTEQLYLAGYFLSRNIFYSTNQEDFNLDNCLLKSYYYKGIGLIYNSNILSERLNFLLNQ